MKLLLILLVAVAAVIIDSLAAPVVQSPETESTSSETWINNINEIKSELEQWAKIEDGVMYKSPFFEEAILPGINRFLKIMDTPLKSLEPFVASHVLQGLKKAEKFLSTHYEHPKRIVGRYGSFEDNDVRIVSLNRLDFHCQLERLHLRSYYYKLHHDRDKTPMDFIKNAYNSLKLRDQGEMISKLYKTKKTAKEWLSESFENLRENFHSFEQIDHFITMYFFYLQLFQDTENPIFQVERECKDSSTKYFNRLKAPLFLGFSTLVLNPFLSIKKKLQDWYHLNPQLSVAKHEPNSKRRRLNIDLSKVVDNFSPESNPLLFSFSTLIFDPIVAIRKEVDVWHYFVAMNQPIDASELLSALEECIKIMNKIEPFVSYSPSPRNYVFQFHQVALQTADKFHDLLKNLIMGFLPRTYLTDLMEKLPEKLRKKLPEEFVQNIHIIPKGLFESVVFVEFCTTYSQLLLQNNYHKLRMNSASMANPEGFIKQNLPHIVLFEKYQPIVELKSLHKNSKEEPKGILEDSRNRALKTLKENFRNLLKGPLRSDKEIEEFVKVNKKYVDVSALEIPGQAWMESHVTRLLDFQPIDINVNSRGDIFIDYNNLDDRILESRRFYPPSPPLSNLPIRK